MLWVLSVGNDTQNEARSFIDNAKDNYVIFKSSPLTTTRPDDYWEVTIDKMGSIDDEDDYLNKFCSNFPTNDCCFFSIKLNYYKPENSDLVLKKHVKILILSWVPDALILANKKRHHTDVSSNVYYIYKLRPEEVSKNCKMACVSSKEHLEKIIHDCIAEAGGHSFNQAKREYENYYFMTKDVNGDIIMQKRSHFNLQRLTEFKSLKLTNTKISGKAFQISSVVLSSRCPKLFLIN